ncbi:EAL domain-containing protein [Pseudoxanthomonas broegbernensis]|nr:EAL domain-containing protein [Pseudoxanthomonas broegbernensis]MBB6066323.1 EAL domain-containing protein (putative c-di-GMP-specific phosphodiesterase class I)/PleD family two-component response regulator [Pseudoxanthomonas broegbernensis]
MFDFRPEPVDREGAPSSAPLTVLSVDDDPAFQQSLRLALSDFRFDDSPLRLLTASSAAEAEELLARTPDVSAILLDVVMESDDAGLRLVRSVREHLGNAEVRIVLVTGQPGMAPMKQTLQQLDISDYWLKTDLYRERLQGIVTGTLRTWREIRALGRAKRGLQQIVQAGRQLAGLHDLGEFSGHMLHELAELLEVPPDGVVCVRTERRDAPLSSARVVGAAGRFAGLRTRPLEDIDDPQIRGLLLEALGTRASIETPTGQVLFFDGGELAPQAAVYLATRRLLDEEERELLRVFATHANAGLVNVDLAARLDQVAYCDALLGIPNGNALQRELERMLAMPVPRGCGLLVVDLDQYIHSSLALGPEQGDLLLERMAGRLRQLYPPPCMVARLHEGTFAVLGPSASLVTDPVAELEQGEDDHALPFLGVDAARVDLDAYRGAASGAVATGLLLLRRARAGGHHEVAEYRAEGEAENRARFLESRALYRAVREGRIHIALQPQVCLEDGRIVGAEVLARWSEGGVPVPPARFIPIAEASGLIVPLGRQVIEQACQALQAMERAGFPDIPLSVNVSPLQLRRREFDEELVELVARYRIEPRRLELEITEGAVMSDYQAGREMLARLRRLGFPLAVDDFGTGYSSLRYVHSLPVSRLKLDRHFTAEIDEEGAGNSVADMIIALGRRLGLDVVAEGVETQAQARWLQRHGCPCAQGYLYAWPEPLDAFLLRLRGQGRSG